MRPLCRRRAARVANSSRVRVQSHGEIHGEKFSAKFYRVGTAKAGGKETTASFERVGETGAEPGSDPSLISGSEKPVTISSCKQTILSAQSKNKPLQSWRKIRRCLTCQSGSQYEQIPLSGLSAHQQIHRSPPEHSHPTLPGSSSRPSTPPPSHALVSRVAVVKTQEDLRWW